MSAEKLLPSLDKLLSLPAGTLKESDRLKDIERWDSLAMIEFIALADEDYGREIAPEDVRKCKTVGDLLLLVPGERA